jgi:sugar phosphate isomerase/epimerase
MFLSLNGSLVAGGKLAWTEMARLAARMGWPGVDVSLSRAMAEGPQNVNALLEHLRLKPAVLDLPLAYNRDDAAFEASLPRLEEGCKFAQAIQCPRMCTYILSSSETPKAELRARYLARFRKGAEIAAKYGVRIGLEFLGPIHLRKMYPHEFIWRMDEMVRFCEECGPNMGLLLDSWHWHHAGATVADILSAGRARIVHVHFNDARRQPAEEVKDDDRLMPGEGVIDLTGFVRALQKVGYADALSVEVLGRGLRQMPPEEGARLGLETARKVMEKAGVAWK